MNLQSTPTRPTLRGARALAAIRSATARPVAMLEASGVRLPMLSGIGTSAVSGISLRHCAGEVLNVLGSEASSLPLLMLLAGQVMPATGSFTLGGIELQQLSDAHRRRLLNFAVGTVLPNDALLPVGTIVDGVIAPMLAQGMPRTPALGRARVMLDTLCFPGHADNRVRDLSPSQARLALFARAITSGTSVLICAEPERSLSAEQVRVLRQTLFTAAKDGGRCVVFTSADERFASLADKTLWL